MPKLIDLAGKRFGRLVALSVSHVVNRRYHWNCGCDCGNSKVVAGADLKWGKTKSCGCFRREFVRKAKSKHGHANKGKVSRTYRSWQMMHRRCEGYTPVHKSRYTDRGIAVCERWSSFENFLADMGEKPEGLTLDRIDNDGNYEPSNCRWADKFTQRNNRSDTNR